jgi:hypothetical protein
MEKSTLKHIKAIDLQHRPGAKRKDPYNIGATFLCDDGSQLDLVLSREDCYWLGTVLREYAGADE